MLPLWFILFLATNFASYSETKMSETLQVLPTLPMIYPYGGTFKRFGKAALMALRNSYVDELINFFSRGVSGQDCMKRSICEAARVALKDEGLLGELLHVLLTPSYGGGLFVDKDYLRAMETGERGDDCLRLYPGCPKGYSVLDLI